MMPRKIENNRLLKIYLRRFFKALIETFFFPKKFQKDSVEKEFLSSYARRFHGYRQAAILLSIVFSVAYFPWDNYMQTTYPDIFTKELIAEIRFVRYAMLSILVTILSISFTRHFKKENIATAWMSFGIGTTAIGVLILSFFVVPYPFNYIHYYLGIYLVIVFLFAFLHLRARPASFSGILILVLIIIFQLVTRSIKADFIAAINYYVSFFLMCHGIGVKFERYDRARFAREKQLIAAKSYAIEERARAGKAMNLAIEEKSRADENTRLLIKVKEEQKAEAEKANANKSIFLAQAAHDLRQPIYALDNSLEALSYAFEKNDILHAKEHLKLAQLSAKEMRLAFNEVLEISHLESGSTKASYSVFDIAELVHEIANNLSAFARKSKVRIKIRVRRQACLLVRSDRQLLSRILTNLISNAIKYSDDSKYNPSVLIGLVCLSTRVRVDIYDNGIGIPRKDWDKIFKPFSQLANRQRDREQGFGLGLAIVRATISLLEEHRIELKSIENKGTRFSVTVPLTSVSKSFPIPVMAPGTDNLLLQGMYVLIVEDDVTVRKSLVALLGQYGVLFESAGSFDEFEQIVRSLEREPDLLITDYRLFRGKTARNVIDLARQNFGNNLPVIVATAELGNIEELEMYSRISILRKPVAPKILLQQMSIYLSQ